MKISQLLSITENTAQEHELLTMLRRAVKQIPNDIDYDFKEGSVAYPKGSFFDGNSTLFDGHGKCLADESDILDHAEQEKLQLLVGGFDIDYENFFVSLNKPEILIKRSTTPGNFTVTYEGKRFDFEKAELQKLISDFHNKVTTYNRITGRKETTTDDDDEAPSWYRRQRHRRPEDDGYERDLDESDFDFAAVELWGGFMYNNLSHS